MTPWHTHASYSRLIYFKTLRVSECHLGKKAVGNKSSSSLVHPVSFFSSDDSILISRVWSCICTWHLLADVSPPLSINTHYVYFTRTKAEAKCCWFTITMSFVLPGGLRVFPVSLFVAVIDFFSAAQMSFLFLLKLFIWKWRGVATTQVELFSPLSKVTTSRGNSLCCCSLFGWFCQQKLIGVHFNSPRALISASGEIPRPNYVL